MLARVFKAAFTEMFRLRPYFIFASGSIGSLFFEQSLDIRDCFPSTTDMDILVFR
jgi:hypothetical protein